MKKKEFFKLSLLIILLLFVSGCIKPPSPPQQDTEKPVVSILSPQDGAVLSDVVEIKIQATDNVGIKKITLYIDGVEKGSVNNSTYTYNWDTKEVSNGSHTITAKAEDTSGNIGEKSINVEVNNEISVGGLVFRDSFEGKTNNASQYTSPTYGGPINSTNNIEFVDGKIGKGVHLYDLSSYVAYTTGYINPSEGTIKFYFKPEPTVYEDYRNLYGNWSIFLLDVSGFGGAVDGAFWVGIGFGGDGNKSKIWGGVYKDFVWSYISEYEILLSSDKFYEIAFVWNQSENKIKLYVDGEKVGEGTYKAPNNTGQIFFIGHCAFDHDTYGPRSMKGIYDELEIYNIDIYK